MKLDDINALLSSPPAAAWLDKAAPTAAALQQAVRALGGSIPAELGRLYKHSDGLLLSAGATLFDLVDFVDVNNAAPQTLPGVVYIGEDGSDGFFCIDSEGAVSGQLGAVLLVDRSNYTADECIFCADHLLAFLQQVLAGHKPWQGPTLGQQQRAAMWAALAAQPDAWDSRPPCPPEALRTAERERQLILPLPLLELLEHSDGLALPAAGVILRPLADIVGVEGTLDAAGSYAALTFADDQRGRSYDIAHHGYQSRPEGTVLRAKHHCLRPTGATTTALQGPPTVTVWTALGPLPVVLSRWLRGEEV